MIHLITGTPGAGKTLRAIHWILQEQKKGRLIFTNIDGLNVKGSLEAPTDWTTTPEGSLVVYDEAQQIFPPDGKTGRSSRPDMAAMELHRHTGHDLILITQHPNLIHSHVRRLVGKHEHLSRAFGWNKALVHLRDQVMRPESKGDLQVSEKTYWTHDKSLFQYYKSASLHVEHKRIPKPVIYALATMAILTVGVVFMWGKSKMLTEGFVALPANEEQQQEEKKSIQTVTTLGKNVYQGVLPPQIAMSGCISTKEFCRCYNDQYEPIFMEQAACRIQMEQPIPRNLKTEDSGRGAQERAPRQNTEPVPIIELTG